MFVIRAVDRLKDREEDYSVVRITLSVWQLVCEGWEAIESNGFKSTRVSCLYLVTHLDVLTGQPPKAAAPVFGISPERPHQDNDSSADLYACN